MLKRIDTFVQKYKSLRSWGFLLVADLITKGSLSRLRWSIEVVQDRCRRQTQENSKEEHAGVVFAQRVCIS